MPPNLKDVALRAGVSTATVSRVLHNKDYVADATRQQVMCALHELDYRMNAVARSLRTGRTRVLGLVITQIYPDPFQAGIALSAEIEARKRGYHLILCNNLQDAENEASSVRLLIEHRVDGLIFGYVVDQANIKMAVRAGLPVVLVERQCDVEGVSMVIADNEAGAFKATDYLFSLGHNEVGIIAAKPNDTVERDVLAGYKRALAKNGAVEREDIMYFGRYDHETGYNGIKEFIAHGRIPTALFVVNDIVALGTLRALAEAGVPVPDGCSIVSHDDTLAPFACPPLTCVAPPVEEMGRLAVDTLVKEVESDRGKAAVISRKIVLSPRLVVRASTCKAKVRC